MNPKEELQDILRSNGKDAEERKGIPCRISGEWYTIQSVIQCPKCDESLSAIGQGTQLYWCDTCENLSLIEVTFRELTDDGSIEVTVGDPKRINGIVRGDKQ
jgi:hypothetical protein